MRDMIASQVRKSQADGIAVDLARTDYIVDFEDAELEKREGLQLFDGLDDAQD